jgi:hypothetical protein
MYCVQCSYALDGLPERRCPECGQPFDPDEPTTFRTRPQNAKDAIVRAVNAVFPGRRRRWPRTTWFALGLVVALLALLTYFTSIGWVGGRAAY